MKFIIVLFSYVSSRIAPAPCNRTIPSDYLKRPRRFSVEPVSPWEHCLSEKDMSVAQTWEDNWSRILTIWDDQIEKQATSFSVLPLSANQLVSTTGSSFSVTHDFGSRKSSHVFIGTSGDDERVFKFETNCLAKRINNKCPECNSIVNEEPLLTEYVISQIVCGSICPRIFAVSGPEMIPEVSNNPLFTILKPRIGETPCWRLNSTFRFVEEEVVGQSVESIFSAKMSQIDRAFLASRVFIQIVTLLENLHDQGFVHGDIHVGNVVQRSTTSLDLDLVLIDFGLSKFFPVEIGTNPRIDPIIYSGLSPSLLSRYQLAGFRTTRRDDLYRAFEIFLTLVSGFEYPRIFGAHGQDANVIKNNPEHVINGLSSYRGIGALMEELGGSFENWKLIFLYLSNELEIDKRPDYDRVRELMKETVELSLAPFAIGNIVYTNSEDDDVIVSGSLI
jgi:hypothetical protein